MLRVNVRKLREELGISQHTLAKEMGVHVRTVQRWEIDTVDPSPLATRRLKEIHAERTGSSAKEMTKEMKGKKKGGDDEELVTRTHAKTSPHDDTTEGTSTGRVDAGPTRRGFLPSVP